LLGIVGRSDYYLNQNPDMADSKFYDVAGYSYKEYWKGRDYEHQAEEVALRWLLKDRHFEHGIDLGGGYGRLTKLIAEYCDKADLVEPSENQRKEGKNFLAATKNAGIIEGTVTKIPFPDNSLDLVLVVRVLHHIPDTKPALEEIARVLKPGGYLLLEFANSKHFKARVRSALKGKSIPRTPVSQASHDPATPFVNHHPSVIREQLADAGMVIEERLSVSNLRSQGLKKVLGNRAMLGLEKSLQRPLSGLDFGPSLLTLAQKK
jgi:SAM-dependent methyltransferase